MIRTLADYFALTKPGVMTLVILSGAAALLLEGSLAANPGRFALALFALYLTGGGAGALNQYLERETDAKMSRTKDRRPLPAHRIGARTALAFALVLVVSGIGIFALFFNVLSAALAAATVVFYSFYYTLWLKPGTHLNIVIGGAAGAMAPLIAWAAATGGLAVTPWLLFLIIFLWTPAHFWALALCWKEDYRAAGLPMLPVVKGDDETLRQIFRYTLALVAASLALSFGRSGWFYLAAAVLLGGWFIRKARAAQPGAAPQLLPGRLFGFSILYLCGLFVAIILDALWGLR